MNGKEGDIINQYVVFTKVINDQIKIYGRKREAITEAIRICKDRNILKDYLTSREKEVVDIMIGRKEFFRQGKCKIHPLLWFAHSI